MGLSASVEYVQSRVPAPAQQHQSWVWWCGVFSSSTQEAETGLFPSSRPAWSTKYRETISKKQTTKTQSKVKRYINFNTQSNFFVISVIAKVECAGG